MQVSDSVIQDLQKRLIGTQNEPKAPIQNSGSNCYLYEAQIPPNTLDQIKQSKPISLRLLHDPSNNKAGLFANTKTPIEHHFELKTLADGLVRPIRDFFQKFRKDNLDVNKKHKFPTTLESEPDSVSAN